MNKLEVNVALWNLIEQREIVESLKIVIGFGHELKEASPIQFGSIRSKKESPGAFTALTDRGNFTVSEEARTELIERQVGIQKERIGHFRIWKQSPTELWFHHFWKSELSTAGGMPSVTEYCISYDQRSLEPRFFSYIEGRMLLPWSYIRLQLGYLKPIWGNSTARLRSFCLVIGNPE